MWQCVLSSRGTVGVIIDHDDVAIAAGDVAACAAGAELDLEAKEPM
jgi:fructose-specific phosphotransferase system component IIB